MDKFLSDASTAYWWLGVVVVGLLINIVSAYLKDPLDKLGSAVSGRWRARTDKVWQLHVLKVEGLKEHPEMHAAERAKEVRFRLQGVASFCRAALLLLMMLLLLTWSNYMRDPVSLAMLPTFRNLLGWFCLASAVVATASLMMGTSQIARASEIAACLREAGAGD